MKGIVACTARNHAGLNLRTWTRAAPDGALATPEMTQTQMSVQKLLGPGGAPHPRTQDAGASPQVQPNCVFRLFP
jgi:hypothetical protein